jgi:hypothetical protein
MMDDFEDVGLDDLEESLIWSAKSQGHHQNQGQHHRGWILITILLRQWNWRK